MQWDRYGTFKSLRGIIVSECFGAAASQAMVRRANTQAARPGCGNRCA